VLLREYMLTVAPPMALASLTVHVVVRESVVTEKAGWWGSRCRTKQKVCFGTSMNFGVRGASVTSEGRRREWVSIVMSWGSRFGDPLWKLGQMLGGRKTDGDAVGGLDDGDGAEF
jgi:hypothetical protein